MDKKLYIFHALQVAHSALFRAADKRTRNVLGLTTTQLAILFVLSKRDGQPIGDIAKSLAMGKSSLTGLVDRMCSQGLVFRREAARDGRISEIFLSEDAKSLVETGTSETHRYNEEILAPFDAEERRTIRKFLDHITNNADTIIAGDLTT